MKPKKLDPETIRINRIIEGAAVAAAKKHGFNPYAVLYMHYFPSEFFENSPRRGPHWHYLRDPATHAALVYNDLTDDILLVEPKRYWHGRSGSIPLYVEDSNNKRLLKDFMTQRKRAEADYKKVLATYKKKKTA